MSKSNARTGRTPRAAAKAAAAPRNTTRGTIKTAGKPAPRRAGPKDRSGGPSGSQKHSKLPKAVAGAVRAALDKKAEDVVVLDLRNADGFTDYFVIATGGNARQIGAIADAVRERLKRDLNERPALAEGVDRSEWILLDYFNFVVHVFSRECRSFYGLERLWGNAQRLEFSDEARRM